MAGFLTAAASMIGGNVIVDSIVRIVIAYGLSRLINRNTGRDAGAGGARQDEGVRLQIAPNTTNSIPLLFGSAFYGGIITDAQLTNQNQTMWYCITLSEVFGFKTDDSTITTRFTDVYWNNQRVVFKADGVTVDYVISDDGVVDASARDRVKIYLYRNGSATPTVITDPEDNDPVYASFSGVDARTLMPGWTNDHKMTNLTFALVRMDYNRDKGITGLPDIKFNVRNDNYRPGDAIYSYLRSGRAGCNLPASAIDIDSLNALNDYADDEVTYLDADGQFKTLADRYQINGVISTTNSVLKNLEQLCAAAGCYLNYDIAQGKWGVVINRDAEPALYFNDSNIISGITVTGTALDGIYNGVEVEFPHRELRDQSDFVRIDLPSEYRNANEPDNTLKIRVDMLNEPLQARELAYLELYQNRMDQIVTFTTDYSKINTEAGDIIAISNSIYGWNNKEFRVIRVKEVESETGGLAVEITAQEYDATMYQAGGQPRRPGVPSQPIGIPTLGAIATPSAPTVLQTNNQNALPNIILRSVVPGSTQAGTSVIVDRMEFWYASGVPADNIPTSSYKLLEVSTNANGNPFTTGSNQDSQPIVTLTAGNYLFRVRAGNANSYSEYSAATALVWDPKQRTDEVDGNTTFQPDIDLMALLGPLAMGAIAYFAYQALKPEILEALSDTDLGKLLGITSPSEIENIKQKMELQASAFRIINAGNVSMSAAGDNTVTFIAGEGIEITAEDIGHEITISAIGGGGSGSYSGVKFTTISVPGQTAITADSSNDTLTIQGGTGISITTDPATDTITITNSMPDAEGAPPAPVTTTSQLEGSVFPCVFGSGATAGQTDSRVAIFTHEHLVYGGTYAQAKLRSENLVQSVDDRLAPAVLAPTLTGTSSTVLKPLLEKQNFPSLWTWNNGVRGANNPAWSSRPPALPTSVATTWTSGPVFHNLYYTTCTYNSAVDLHAQSWGPWRKFYSATETVTNSTDNYTNPPPNRTQPYRVDRQYECGAIVLDSDGPGWTEYDSFIPNVNQPIVTTEQRITYYPSLGIVTIPDGKLVAFGVSCFNLPDNTAYNTNTIFGYVDTQTGLTFESALNITQTASNGSGRWVGISNNTSRVYYSNNGRDWIPVTSVTFDGTITNFTATQFSIVAYGNGKFYVWKPGVGLSGGGGVAESSDGIAWTEKVSNMAAGITRVSLTGSTWLATGTNITQQSVNGITWTTIA